MESVSYNKLTGVQKAAIILLSLEEEQASAIFEMMTEEEIKEISSAMSALGAIKREVMERLIFDFSNDISNAVSFTGNLDSTERLLEKILGKEKLSSIMDDIRGPAGKDTWDKLSNVNEDLLASYLKNEYPQTIALIISRMAPVQASKILGIVPDDLSLNVIVRLLGMGSVKKEIVDSVEETLKNEFIKTLSKTQKQDSFEMMAEIFNNFDRTNEEKYMGLLEGTLPEAAEKIKSLMFKFDDLRGMDSVSVQNLLRIVDKGKLALALKGTSEELTELFMDNMSQRAATIMKEDIEALGPVKMKDVDEAQLIIINQVKDLMEKGEVILSDGDGEDELVY